MSADHSYRPGGWSAVVHGQTALLVDPSLPIDRLLVIWDLVRSDAAVEQVLDVLTERGLGATPGFALVAADPAGARVVARRPASVELVDPDGRVVLIDGAASTWVDGVHPSVAAARLQGPVRNGADCPFPCLAGVVAADAVHWSSRPAPVEPGPPARPPAPQPETAVEPVPDPGLTLGLPDTLAELPQPADPALSMGFDALFGDTRRLSVEFAAVRGQEGDEGPGPAGRVPGLINAVPSSVTGSGQPAQPAGAVAGADRTVSMAELVRLGVLPSPAPAAAAPAQPGPSAAVTVLAIHCPAGHPNPPQSDRCRNCEAPLAWHEPETVLRPTLGVLRFSTGQVVPLDQPVLVGRAPKVERAAGTELPVPVRIQDYGDDLSRNHVEIRIEGWQAFAVDLNSRNGTVVLVPGRKPQALDPLAPFPLPPGARVALSDQVSFLYEVNR